MASLLRLKDAPPKRLRLRKAPREQRKSLPHSSPSRGREPHGLANRGKASPLPRKGGARLKNSMAWGV
mgnify:CR=1 FL=1